MTKKSEAIPATLFKYYSASTTKIVLRTGKLRWSAPTTFNDPYDAQFGFSMEGDEKMEIERFIKNCIEFVYGSDEPRPQYKTALNELLLLLRNAQTRPSTPEQFAENLRSDLAKGQYNAQSYLASQNNFWKNTIKTARILCLTELNDNMPMWAHYADNHKGVAIELQSVKSLDSAWLEAKKVEYRKKMPRLGSYRGMFDSFLGYGPILNSHDLHHNLTYVKHTHWDYEKEWRVVTYANSQESHSDYKLNPLELKAIYFGINCSNDDKSEIQDLISLGYPFTEVFQMSINPDEYSMVSTIV